MPLGIDFAQILLHLFNVVILFTGLYLLLYAPVKKFMKKREDHYREMDDTAKKNLEAAEEKEKKYDDRLKSLDTEIADRKKQAEAELDEFRQKKKAEAEKEAEGILSSASKKAAAERAGIVSGAKDDITKIVEEAAEKVALQGDTQAVYEAFLKQAEGTDLREAERSSADDGK